MSNNDQSPTRGQVVRAENLAAELTNAVYPLLLRRGLKSSWLKTELIVWRRLTRTIKRWIAERPRATTARELDVLRERLLGGDSEELAALLCDRG